MRAVHPVLLSQTPPSQLGAFNPCCRVICALTLAAAISSVQTWTALTVGLILPVLLIFVDSFLPLARALVRLNGLSIFVWIVLPLTVPGERWGIFSLEGFNLALWITIKMNLISVVLMRMVVPLGVSRINGVLHIFRVPQKMRVLLLLTLRCVLLLSDRVAALTQAVLLRAPGLRGRLMCRAFACMLGSALIHSSDRAERMMLAIRCRGGMGGFLQHPSTPWRTVDTVLFGVFTLNVFAMGCASLLF